MESAVGRVEATGRGKQTEDRGRRMRWKHGHGTDTISMPVTRWQGRIRKAAEYVRDMGATPSHEWHPPLLPNSNSHSLPPENL